MEKWTLDRFIAYCGWEVATSAHRARMALVLEVFQSTVPASVGGLDALLRPLPPERVCLYNTRTGRANWLTQLMQAIDFDHPVEPGHAVGPGTTLVQFRRPGQVDAARPGHYFARPDTSSEQLALPADQTSRTSWTVRKGFSCLCTFAGDNFTDWVLPPGPSAAPTTRLYRHGGGRQLFLWEPLSVVAPL